MRSFSNFILFNPKLLLRGSLYAPREHSFDIIPVAKGVSADAEFQVGCLLLTPVEVCFDGFEGENQQPIPFIFEQ